MPRWPTRASGSRRRKPSTIPRPARSTGTIATSPSRRLPLAGSSGVSTVTSRVGRSRVASMARIADASSSARRNAPWDVARSRRITSRSASTGCSTTMSLSGMRAILARRRTARLVGCRVMAPPRRNVELKARDPDPARSLERCVALGAEDRGELRQRDTYFAAPRGRLKLREQEPGGAELIAYERPDRPDARESRYRLAPVADGAVLREALGAALGTTVVVAKRRRLLVWEGVRIHLDDVEGLGAFVELEGVAEPGSDLTAEAGRVARLRAELGIADEDLVATGYADLLAGAAPDDPGGEELLRAAAAVMRHAHVPYSRFPVGAALRAADGSIHAAANVENAAYPQGQCAEASAIGVLVAAGATEITEVAVVAERLDICPPCGGCRQRLSEFARPETLVHLGRPGGPRRTMTLGELLPLGFGPEALP